MTNPWDITRIEHDPLGGPDIAHFADGYRMPIPPRASTFSGHRAEHIIRGHVYRRTVDVRSVTDHDTILIPAGWTIQIRINGITTTYRDGIPTWHNIIRGIKYGIIHNQTSHNLRGSLTNEVR